VGIGFGYRLTNALYLDAGYEHAFAGGHGDMSKSLNNTDPFTHAIVLNGKYTIAVDIAALSFRYKL
jgi:hypothetical protein